MWAVVEIGKKQYKVEKGDVISVERLKGDNDFSFDKVLLLNKNKKTEVGKPYIKGATVEAKAVEEFKDGKVTTYKYLRRKKYRKTIGHRQIKTLLKISNIKSS